MGEKNRCSRSHPAIQPVHETLYHADDGAVSRPRLSIHMQLLFGHQDCRPEIRSQDIEVSLASLRAAKAAGVKLIMFTSDNFNKYPDAAIC